MTMTNSKSYIDRIQELLDSTEVILDTIKSTFENSGFGFTEVSKNGFRKSNVIADFSKNVSSIAIPEEATMPSLGIVNGYTTVNALPLKGYTKNGVNYADPENPAVLFSSTSSNTVATDREDGNLNIDRWSTRTIFKFTAAQYKFDRCIYKIPLADLANGIVINDGSITPHENTLKSYPYPEEFIMISQKTEKNFIHFINVQYTDAHYGHFNGRNYNLMIVKDRLRYGVVNSDGSNFEKYTSVYANGVETELSYVKDGYLYLTVPDEGYGEELLDTLWDCRVIWRSDAPDRNVTITAEVVSVNSTVCPELTTANDMSVCDDRVIIHLPSRESRIASNRDSIDSYALSRSHVHSAHGSLLMTNTAISVAPNFTSNYTPKQSTELIWQITGAPNQVFRISDNYYLGFYYYNTIDRGSVTATADLSNHTTQLYWALFDNTLKTVNPATSGETLYPCKNFISSFVNSNKILRVFRENINTNSGISTFLVATQKSIYQFTFTLNNTTISAEFKLLASFTFTSNLIMRISENEFLAYTDTNVYTVTTSGESAVFIAESANALVGKYLSCRLGGNGVLYPIPFDNIASSTPTSPQTVNPTARKAISGKYGYFTTAAGNTMCKLVERFMFDKLLTYAPVPAEPPVTTIEVNVNEYVWSGLCYGADKFVVVNYDSDRFIYSTDGIAWYEGSIGSSLSWQDVKYGNGKYIAVASGPSATYAYSNDGITWALGNFPNARNWRSVCYGNGKYVALAHQKYAAYSTDGINWTEVTISNADRAWFDIAFGNNMFVAVARLDTVFAYSTNGINWTEVTIGTTNREWWSVCYGGGKFVAIAWYSYYAAYSTDGINWTEVTIGNDTESQLWTSICYGNGKFVAVASSSNIIAYSSNGIDWTLLDIDTGVTDGWQQVIYGKDRFIAIPISGKTFMSLTTL